MQAIEVSASFDENGELKINNLPIIKNQKVRLLILLEEGEREEWHRFSGTALLEAYGEDEPSYSLDILKEPNPDYRP